MADTVDEYWQNMTDEAAMTKEERERIYQMAEEDENVCDVCERKFEYALHELDDMILCHTCYKEEVEDRQLRDVRYLP